jgi:hypothetical protein
MKTSTSAVSREKFSNRQSPRHAAVRRMLCLFAIAAGLTALATVSSAQIAPAQLLSARNASVVPPAGGNGNSLDAVISADGRFVVFSSVASDLAPGGSRQFFTDIFLRDRASNTTTMVTANLAGSGGGNGCSLYGQVSTNGQFVLFETQAGNLAAGASNWVGDVIVRNLAAGTNILVSVATNGGQANGRSYDAIMTPDGRYVAFVSGANNLVPTNTYLPAVFLRDLVAGTTTLVNAGSPSSSSYYPPVASPQITPDGSYIAYFSSATGMVAGASGNGDIYVFDLVDETTTWASADASNLVQSVFGLSVSNIVSDCQRMSDDGQLVAFKSGSTSAAGCTAILVYDQIFGITTLVATNAVGSLPDDENRYGPEMTSNGRFIAYVGQGPSGGGTNLNVYVWDSVADTNILVSIGVGGFPTNSISDTPVFSGNGRYLAFRSNAANLVTNAVSPGFHIYLRDLEAGTTELVDADTNSAGSTDVGNTFISMNADGSAVAFDAPDGSLVNGDNNNALDVFARDTVAGTNELISQRNPALLSATGSDITRMTSASISGDGRWLVFESFANDLVPNDANGSCDVFLRDLWTGQTTLVSAGLDGNPALGGHSWSGVISANGRYVAFASAATNLTANYASGTNFNIFRRDLQTGTTVLISVSTNGVDSVDTPSGYHSPLSSCSYPVISADGQYVTFLSSAKNLSTNIGSGTFWRDVNAGTTIGLKSINSQFLPSMSADGRYVAYQTNQFRIFDTQLGMDIYTNTTTFTSASISPDGSKILFGPNSGQISVVQIATGTNLLTASSAVQVQNSGQWSSDGRYVTFSGNGNYVTLFGISRYFPLNLNIVYLCDLVTSNLTLVSSWNPIGQYPITQLDMPVISADGRFVCYRSFATNLVAGDVNSMPKIFLYDQLSGTNAIVSVSQTNSSTLPWISGPVISSGAENVAFLNVSSDVVSNDLNRVTDAFAVRVLFNLQISPVVTSGATTTLTWQVVPTRTYAVQFKNNLTDPLWQTLSANISFIGNEANVTVPADQPNRFYRVVETQ